MLYREIEVFIVKTIWNTYIVWTNGQFWYAEAGGTYSNHWELKGLTAIIIHDTRMYMCLNEWCMHSILINLPEVPCYAPI
jgi:hypothetical protein